MEIEKYYIDIEYSITDISFDNIGKDKIIQCLSVTKFENAIDDGVMDIEYGTSQFEQVEFSKHIAEYLDPPVNIYDHVEVDVLVRALVEFVEALDDDDDQYVIQIVNHAVKKSRINISDIKDFPENHISKVKSFYKEILSSKYDSMLYGALTDVLSSLRKDGLLVMLSVMSKDLVIRVIESVMERWEIMRATLEEGLIEYLSPDDFPFYEYYDEYMNFRDCIE